MTLKKDLLRRKCRALMLQHGITTHMLAEMTGFGMSYVYCLITGSTSIKRGRCLIEYALGEAIWSTEEEFIARKRLSRLLNNREPFGVNVSELRELAGRARIRGRTVASKEALIGLLIANIAALEAAQEKETGE